MEKVFVSRHIEFEDTVFQEVKRLAEEERRSFKAQAAILIDEALAARKSNNTAA